MQQCCAAEDVALKESDIFFLIWKVFKVHYIVTCTPLFPRSREEFSFDEYPSGHIPMGPLCNVQNVPPDCWNLMLSKLLRCISSVVGQS